MDNDSYNAGYRKGVKDMLGEIESVLPDADPFYDIADDLIKENMLTNL